MTDPLKNPMIMIPMIRKILPKLIAQDIVGVQPMDLTPPKWVTVTNHNETVPEGYVVVDVNREVSHWIEQQALYMWKHGELKATRPGFWDRYIISEELLTWLSLRWS
jgi:hypothetical protein